MSDQPVRCFRCKGRGQVRAKADLLTAVFTFGISALADKSNWLACRPCGGRGYIR